MGAHGQEDWFDEVMPGLDDGRPGGERRFPWPGRHGKDDGDEAEARTRPRIGVRVGVATVIATGLMVGAGLTAGMVSANRRERLADASAACERSTRAWSAGSAAWGRDRDRIMGSVDLTCTVGSDSSRNRRRGCSTTGPRPRRTWTGSPRASTPWSPRSPPARDDGPPYDYRSGARVYGQTDQETGRNRSCRVGQRVPFASNAL
ncbi:hypothetical protein B5780_0653 [Bifidobacterium longum]|nr:hypothetical protein B5780_0653 [Bifidobacterium longum]